MLMGSMPQVPLGIGLGSLNPMQTSYLAQPDVEKSNVLAYYQLEVPGLLSSRTAQVSYSPDLIDCVADQLCQELFLSSLITSALVYCQGRMFLERTLLLFTA